LARERKWGSRRARTWVDLTSVTVRGPTKELKNDVRAKSVWFSIMSPAGGRAETTSGTSRGQGHSGLGLPLKRLVPG